MPDKSAAYVLFSSDRTCCVCREPGKPVQIHHIDGNRDNNMLNNLAVLCLECHNATQVQGGFDRKLDPDQVVLYRDNWHRIVSQQRSARYSDEAKEADESRKWPAEVSSIAEIYRENEEYGLLAMHYDLIGNDELRDKYIELALKNDPDDETICFLRGLQGRSDLIPADVAKRRLDVLTKYEDWNQRARIFDDLDRPVDAVRDYVRGIKESIDEGNLFSAAYYLKELADAGLIEKLFALCYEEAKGKDDVYWMVRSLEELGWKSEITTLVTERANEIEKSGDLTLLLLLARARGDEEKARELLKEIARRTHMVNY